MQNLENSLICSFPFSAIEINSIGDVTFCCACHISGIFIGNIFKNTLKEIWNSETAIEYRKKILNNDYSLCNEKICFDLKNQNAVFVNKTQDMKPIMEQLPTRINLGYDTECNSRCIYCRDKIIKHSFLDNLKLNQITNKILLPLLKDVKFITLNSSGECLASKHSRNLIKKLSEINPKVEFEILTNGIMANKKTFKQLNIEDKINTIRITINAATKNTYEKICRNNSFDKIIKNLLYLSELKKKNKIKTFSLIFVVSDLNYFEIPEFQKLANNVGATVAYWEFRDQGFKTHENFKELAIHLPTHKNHNELIKVLQNPIFNNPDNESSLNPVLRELRNKNITTSSLEH